MADAKERVVQQIQAGKTVAEAMAMAGRNSTKTYESWRKNDEAFRRRVDLIRELRDQDADERRSSFTGDFIAFRDRYLGMKTFRHQAQWVDVIEGREPRDLHPSMTYEKGQPNYVLINTAPEHSKTITLSVDYITYLVCKDPSVRILICSETQKRAKEMLYAVKARLTHPRYRDLQLAFAPMDGYKESADAWRDDYIYLGGEIRDSPEKDPTIQALGIGGQIYGARCTHIILDDTVVLSNAHQWESQLRWLQQEVLTRLGPTGKLIIAGTRVDATDLYSVLRDGDRYPDGRSPWTYLAQPAVLEFADEPRNWVTLWPRSDQPWPGRNDPPGEDGLYPRWDGPTLYARRGLLDPRTWALVYQQEPIPETAVFNPANVKRCVNGNRTVGPMQKGNKYHRAEGMDGLYVVCSMDPAMTGDTAAIAYALDLKTQKRFVLDAHRMTAPTPQKIRDLIHSWTDRYKPAQWVIEKNAFQLYLTRDPEVTNYLASRGVVLREHYTGGNKTDPDFGVASMAALFDSELIELPSSHNSEGVKSLVEQLVIWAPGMAKKQKQDLPMALWFAETMAREMVDRRVVASRQHRNSRFVPRYAQRNQVVVNLEDYFGREDSDDGVYGVLPAM